MTNTELRMNTSDAMKGHKKIEGDLSLSIIYNLNCILF